MELWTVSSFLTLTICTSVTLSYADFFLGCTRHVVKTLLVTMSSYVDQAHLLVYPQISSFTKIQQNCSLLALNT